MLINTFKYRLYLSIPNQVISKYVILSNKVIKESCCIKNKMLLAALVFELICPLTENLTINFIVIFLRITTSQAGSKQAHCVFHLNYHNLSLQRYRGFGIQQHASLHCPTSTLTSLLFWKSLDTSQSRIWLLTFYCIQGTASQFNIDSPHNFNPARPLCSSNQILL